ncbi:hypothetical protein FSW04_07470 [Baekduia soli]|uniref:Uncharacterized protein n=1 Tax=Baekduia soli TaxID=496014 RepID=A0A5B8U309_9ACTN|nr:hypothetical protein [Baekduia soli]QEC47437.1 hypothetical protein FSW04_07470 [Baekduia soli]
MVVRLVPLSVLAVAAVALTACGGSSSSSSSQADASTTTGGNASRAKFRQCLADQGVTLPDRTPPSSATPPPTGAPPSTGTPPGPGGGGFGAQDPKTRKAFQACAKYRPRGRGRLAGPGNGQGPNAQVFTAYLSCIKSKGLKIDASQGFRALGSLDRSDPKVTKALNACQSKLPQGPPAGGAPPANAPAGQT